MALSFWRIQILSQMLLIYLPGTVCPHFIEMGLFSRMECHAGPYAQWQCSIWAGGWTLARKGGEGWDWRDGIVTPFFVSLPTKGLRRQSLQKWPHIRPIRVWPRSWNSNLSLDWQFISCSMGIRTIIYINLRHCKELLIRVGYFYPHFTDKRTETQRW